MMSAISSGSGMRFIGMRCTLERLVFRDAIALRIGGEALFHALGLGRPGIYADDAHAARRVSVRQPHGREHQRRVRRAAADVCRRCHLAAAADDVDDGAPAARRHAFDQRIDDVDVAEVLRVHGRVPRLGREVFSADAPCTAGAIH